MNHKVLMVDDDTNILSSYVRNFKSYFHIVTSSDPIEALEMLKKNEDFAVIVSDYKMPVMDGVKFLSEVKTLKPDSVRIMLTGYADTKATIDSVNEGNIFRFLTKPCPPEKLVKAIKDGIELHNVIVAEKILLQRTLKGAIKVLIDILSAVNPIAFSRAMRLSELSMHLAKRLNVSNLWEIEIAALLSQIGCVTIPSVILEKKYQDKPLTFAEVNMYLEHPKFGSNLIKNIPRLENIALGILQQFECYNLNDDGRKKDISRTARFLKVANDYETYLESGKNSTQALFQMHKDSDWYDPEILAALDAEVSGIETNYILETLNSTDLQDGMRIGENIIDTNGNTLLTRGNKLNDVLIMKLQNMVRLKIVFEPFKILVPVKDFK